MVFLKVSWCGITHLHGKVVAPGVAGWWAASAGAGMERARRRQVGPNDPRWRMHSCGSAATRG
jgi:hypothetical protein